MRTPDRMEGLPAQPLLATSQIYALPSTHPNLPAQNYDGSRFGPYFSSGKLLGLGGDSGSVASLSRRGGWAIAQSPIMRTTVTEARLAQRGYQSFTKYY